ncbi:MAG: ribonuclease HII [Clostridiales bacterium]|nr:ribonuclease HII [Clostridiales bacterium]
MPLMMRNPRMGIDRAAKAAALLAAETAYRSIGVCAGIDEAGRGPLAGNVTAACVIMPPEPLIAWVDDSKKLSEKRRERVYDDIVRTALHIGIGTASAKEIDRINILEATRLAMRRAAEKVPADVYLVDAVQRLGLSGNEIAIVHGDAVSYSIAAASIVAKVTRDREMKRLHALYPAYGFDQHKGYGTAKHIAALRLHGPSPIHRRSFIGHLIDNP